jgi:hypothetical protein
MPYLRRQALVQLLLRRLQEPSHFRLPKASPAQEGMALKNLAFSSLAPCVLKCTKIIYNMLAFDDN